MVGAFWANSADLLRQLTEFVVKGKSGDMRIQISGDVSLETADKLVAEFLAGKIEFASDSVHDQVEIGTMTRVPPRIRPDYEHPTQIESYASGPGTESYWPKAPYWVSFAAKLDQFGVELDGDKVRILAVVHVRI